MKKGGILNPAICSLLAELGQTDELLIVDAAYPLPTDGHVIDLTLTPGIPRLLDVLRAVAEELVIESIAVPVEIKEYSPRLFQEISRSLATSTSTRSRFTNSRNSPSTSRASSALPSSAPTPTSASWPEVRSDGSGPGNLTWITVGQAGKPDLRFESAGQAVFALRTGSWRAA